MEFLGARKGPFRIAGTCFIWEGACPVSAGFPVLGQNGHRSFFPGEGMRAHLSLLPFLSRFLPPLGAAGNRKGQPALNMSQKADEAGEAGVAATDIVASAPRGLVLLNKTRGDLGP